MALSEVVPSGLEGRHGQQPRLNILSALAALAILGDSLWQAFQHPMAYQMGYKNEARFATFSYSCKRDVLVLEIFALVFALAVDWRRRDPIRWGRYRLGIIAGFGAPAIITLLAQLLRTYFGATYEEAFRYMTPGAYFGQMLIWLWCFFRDEAHGTQVARQREVPSSGKPNEPRNGSLQTPTVLPKPC